MIQFILFYFSIGFFLSILINTSLWFTGKPVLTAGQTLISIIIWPSIINLLVGLSTGDTKEDIIEED